MATEYKILGQVAPTVTSTVDLYVVPFGTQAVVSTISVTNDTATSATFRIFIRKGNFAAGAINALYFDTPLAGNSTLLITAGITLGSNDKITVQSNTANAFGFQAFGSEVYN